MSESFVDVSPSTVIRLNEPSATCAVSSRQSGGATAASVAMNASMVAMLGLIIPAPFATPVTTIDRPSIDVQRDAALGRVSVS